MLNKKKVFLKKRETRNENLTATAKESGYTAVLVSETVKSRYYHTKNIQYSTVLYYHKSKRPILVLW